MEVTISIENLKFPSCLTEPIREAGHVSINHILREEKTGESFFFCFLFFAVRSDPCRLSDGMRVEEGTWAGSAGLAGLWC